jgi:hypothetical protein
VSAARRIALAPAPSAPVVSLDEWRAARRVPVEPHPVADEPTPLRLLRLVVDGEAPPPFSLDVFLRRARAVMGEAHEQTRFDVYRDAEPA